MSGILRSNFKKYFSVSCCCCVVHVFRRSLTTKMPFYAVANGRNTGIYSSWAACEAQVKGFSGAKFQKFDTASGASNFIHSNSSDSWGNTSQSNSYRSAPNTSYAASSNNYSSSFGSSTYYGGDKPNDFEKDNEGFVQVYTDGACSANGQHGARAGVGVYWGHQHHLNRSEPVSGRATNNSGEIQAATLAMKTALQNGVEKLTINTDSKFLIDSATKWMPGWKERGWTLSSGEPVKNETDFKELDKFQSKLEVKWNYVPAHTGQSGNEMADKLAKAGAASYKK